jgi:hypothetical protein
VSFEINNDLNRLIWNHHNQFHVAFTFAMTVIGPWWSGYASMFLWEVGDGFKPWYYDFRYNPEQPHCINWARENFLYSDKFSLQDVCVWNLAGFAGGLIVRALFYGLF